MAFFTDTVSGGVSFGDKLAALWVQFKEARAQRAAFKRTYNELNNLSSRELQDLGLSQSMIHRLSYEAAYKG